MREHALGDEAHRIADEIDVDAVAGEGRAGAVAPRLRETRVGEQTAALLPGKRASKPTRRLGSRSRATMASRRAPSGVTTIRLSSAGRAASSRATPGASAARRAAASSGMLGSIQTRGAAADGRAGAGGRIWLAVDVAVEARASLAAEQPALLHPSRQHLGPVARLFVVLVIDRLHDRVGDVEAGQIEQLAGAELESTGVAQARRRAPPVRRRLRRGS